MSYEQLLLDSLDKRFQDEQLRRLENSEPTQRVWLLGVHERANMGDMALTYTAEVLLRKLFPRREHITMSRSVVTHNWQKVKPLIRKGDFIFMPGGGNLGDLWPHEEVFRQLIIKSFPQNKIVILPQSVCFKEEVNKTKAAGVYRGHDNLLVFARDEQSYNLLKEIATPERVALSPDLVFSYEYPVPFLPQDRTQVLVIARNDKEEGDYNLLQEAQKSSLSTIVTALTDTLYSDLEYHGTSFAAKSIYKKIDQCHAAGVIITNRLHGVIFGLLAGRPVIAYENSYGKIGGALNILPQEIKQQVTLLQEAPDKGLVQELQQRDDLATPVSTLLAERFTEVEQRIMDFLFPRVKPLSR